MMGLIIAVKITDINPVHARLSIFTSGKRNGWETLGTGLSGNLCIDAEVLQEFIERLNPERVHWEVASPAPKWVVDWNETGNITQQPSPKGTGRFIDCPECDGTGKLETTE